MFNFFFITLSVLLVMIGAGCTVRPGAPPTPAISSGAVGFQSVAPFRNIPLVVPTTSVDLASSATYTEKLVDEIPRPRVAVFVAILTHLRQGQNLVEITRSPVLKLPEPFIREQLTHYFRLGNVYFALAERDTFNQPRSHGAKQAALLYARSGDQSWQYFFPVEDVGERPDTIENNPLYFWNEGSVLQFVITDIQGAGSGEGTAKWLTSADGGKSWRIAKCFYLSLGEFLEPNQPSRRNFVVALRRYLTLPFSPYNEQYHFNTSTGNFEQLQQTEVSSEKIVVVSECRNFRLPE